MSIYFTALIIAALDVLAEGYSLYVYKYQNRTSVINVDENTGTLQLSLTTPNLAYVREYIPYNLVNALDIVLDRTPLTKYFPYIDPAITLKYDSAEKNEIHLQHHQLLPHAFKLHRPGRMLGAGPGSTRVIESTVPPKPSIEACYSTTSPFGRGLFAQIILYTDGSFDGQIMEIISGGKRTLLPRVFFCNANIAENNIIQADGWSLDSYPYVHAPWTLGFRGGDRSAMVLSLGKGQEYNLSTKACPPVNVCPS